MADNKTGIIYVIDNTINEMKYVGQTQRTIKIRWITGHKHCANEQIRTNGTKYQKTSLYEAMRIHGIDKFHIKSIEENIPIDKLDEREIFWIKELNTQTPNGYNLTAGGGGLKPLGDAIDNTFEHMRRNELSKGLPQYVSYDKSTGRFLINHHPLCATKSFYVSHYESIDAVRAACLSFLKHLEENGIIYETIPKIKLGDVPLPIGIQQHRRNGYRVIKKYNGVVYKKYFGSHHSTKYENYLKALDYLSDLDFEIEFYKQFISL